MKHYELISYCGAGLESRFYIDGKRTSREKFSDITQQAYSFGRLECFSTSCKMVNNGFRRKNCSSAVF